MNSRGMLLWLAAGGGVILIYAAYKNVSPASIVTGYFGAGGSVAAKPGASGSGTPSPKTPARSGTINKNGTVA